MGRRDQPALPVNRRFQQSHANVRFFLSVLSCVPWRRGAVRRGRDRVAFEPPKLRELRFVRPGGSPLFAVVRADHPIQKRESDRRGGQAPAGPAERLLGLRHTSTGPSPAVTRGPGVETNSIEALKACQGSPRFVPPLRLSSSRSYARGFGRAAQRALWGASSARFCGGKDSSVAGRASFLAA